jgi:flagellin
MTSINAGGAFYRVQNSLTENSENVSKSMQRLASGRQNIAPGDRSASVAVAFGMKAEMASLKIGVQNATEALQALEMANNDLSRLNDMMVRLEELNALGSNGLNSTQDIAAIDAEADAILIEYAAVVTRASWKGKDVFADVTGSASSVGFGRNAGSTDVWAGKAPALTVTAAKLKAGTDTAALAVDKGKLDEAIIAAGASYNRVNNILSHLASLNAGYAIDVASKMDVDFAGETTELAKGQILAQAGTAMLAQANAQGQGMLALIQS